MAFESMLITGVQNHYGPRVTDLKFGSKIGSVGQIKSAAWTFDYDDLPVSAASNQMVQIIPASSIILEAYFTVITAFADGTSYDIDIVETDGTAQGTGEDNLWDLLGVAEIDATEVVLALKASTHGGTDSGTRIGYKLVTAGQLQVVAAGTFTAGRARIVVDYLTVPAA